MISGRLDWISPAFYILTTVQRRREVVLCCLADSAWHVRYIWRVDLDQHNCLPLQAHRRQMEYSRPRRGISSV
jgi:hypothetical protein